MSPKKGLILLLVVLGFIGGVYYWNWYTLHHTKAISEPVDPVVTLDDEEHQKKDIETAATDQTTSNHINILVLGTDNRGDEVARSDLMMFVRANIDTCQAAVVSIPRDTRVDFPGIGLTKINHINAIGQARGGIHQGTLESAKIVSNFLGVPIHYYIKIDFQGFVKAVDAVGGIDVNLPNPVNDDVRQIYLPAGINHLTGDQALRLSRARYGLPNGDFGRQFNQFNLLTALAGKMLNFSNITKLPEYVNLVYQHLIDTNMSASQVIALGFRFKGITKDHIQYYQLPGKGIYAQDPLVGAAVYYFEPDMDGIQRILKQVSIDMEA